MVTPVKDEGLSEEDRQSAAAYRDIRIP